MRRGFLGILVMTLSVPLFAGDATGRIAIGGAGGWADLLARKEDRRATHGDVFGSAWLRLGLTKKNELIFSYDSIPLKVKNDSSANQNRIRPLTVGLWRSLWTDKSWTPVATLGVGGADLQWQDPSGAKSHSAFATQGGLGLEYFPTRMVSVGALARLHYVVNSSAGDRTEVTAYTLGFMANLLWGGPEPSPVAPPPTEAVVVLPPKDTDGDGVSDAMDACPETPPRVPVDSRGCPQDSDADGVIDPLDQCPGTPPGALVNAEGCPVEKVSVALDVKFETGKIAVASEDDAQFQKVADFMKNHPETSVLVEGYSDNVGLASMNKVLSQKRADAVRNILVWKFGIAASRVSAKGFGAESPIADNKTPKGRAANRRVVAVITANKN